MEVAEFTLKCFEILIWPVIFIISINVIEKQITKLINVRKDLINNMLKNELNEWVEKELIPILDKRYLC